MFFRFSDSSGWGKSGPDISGPDKSGFEPDLSGPKLIKPPAGLGDEFSKIGLG